MNKLNYTSFLDLKADFDAGAKFVVVDCGRHRHVTAVEVSGPDTALIRTGSSRFSMFRPDGSHSLSAYRLIKVLEIPAPAAKSFLERFLDGEQFHTPHTREYVTDVQITRGSDSVTVTLSDENGKSRTTPRYHRSGRHLHRPERNLVAGKLPPKLVDVKVAIYKHAYNDSLFCVREGEVLPNIRGLSNALKVGEAVIREPKK